MQMFVGAPVQELANPILEHSLNFFGKQAEEANSEQARWMQQCQRPLTGMMFGQREREGDVARDGREDIRQEREQSRRADAQQFRS